MSKSFLSVVYTGQAHPQPGSFMLYEQIFSSSFSIPKVYLVVFPHNTFMVV